MVGKTYPWIAQKVKQGWQRHQAQATMAKAVKKVKENPKFAQSVREKIRKKQQKMKPTKPMLRKEDYLNEWSSDLHRKIAKGAGAANVILGTPTHALAGLVGAGIGAAGGKDVPSAILAASGFTIGTLLSAAAHYYVGKGAWWIIDRVANGKSKTESEKILEAAKEMLKTDPKFAAKVKKKAQEMKTRKEDYAAIDALISENASEFRKSVNDSLKKILANKLVESAPIVIADRFKPQQEKRFVAMHGLEKHEHPVAPEHTFTTTDVDGPAAVETELASKNTLGQEEIPDPLSTVELMKKARILGRADTTSMGADDSEY